MSAQHSKVSAEWYTPPWLVERARRVLGEIAIDVASSHLAQSIVKAERWYSLDRTPWAPEVDGAPDRPWWCNPPTPAVTWWRGLMGGVRIVEGRLAPPVPGAFLLFNIDQLGRCEGWSLVPVCILRKRVPYLSTVEAVTELHAQAWRSECARARKAGKGEPAAPRPVVEVVPGLARGPQPPHGSAVLFPGCDPRKVREVFHDLGEIVG